MNKLPNTHLLKNPLVSAVLLGACALGIGTMCLRFVLGRLDGQGTRHVPRSLESKLENHEPQSEPQMPRSTQTPNGPAPALRVIAAYALSTGRSLTRPIISGGKFWIGSSSGTLEGHSISPTKNEKKWTLRKTLPISEAPLLIPSRSIMLVTETPSTITATSRLTALQSQPPKILWEREFDGLVAISADEKSNTFFAATDVFGLWAFRLTDGSPLWQSLPPGRPAAGILVSNDTVYIPSSRQTTQSGSKARRYETTLHALSANFGNIRWSIRLPGAPWGTPIEDPFNRDVLLTTQTQERGWAHAIEASSGKLRWTWELPARPVKKSVTIASAGVVVHALESGEVIALRLSG
ncbi:MAG: PQQ-binding-like beta-propeller repeat protein, partial [Bdellovibrionales bacterium]|nr:PQQ-binding-like beta-propeller repeat protein [Bdellovibrionales bacterium]